MTRDSQESSPEDLQQHYQTHRRATKAMLERIVVRGAVPRSDRDDMDAELESSIRSAIWKSEEAVLRLDPSGEHKPNYPLSLVETIAGSHLDELATPGRPLTSARLRQIDPSLVEVAETMDQTDIGWPSDETVFHDVLPHDYDDYAFAFRLASGSKAYNNFPKLLMTAPSYPEEGEDYVAFMRRTTMHHYATKPYLARAYALQPEFMQTLQGVMVAIGSPQEWRERLMDAAENEDADPEDLVLLRASRLSYQLLINLMRSDDNRTQAKITTMSLQNDITDPVEELWT